MLFFAPKSELWKELAEYLKARKRAACALLCLLLVLSMTLPVSAKFDLGSDTLQLAAPVYHRPSGHSAVIGYFPQGTLLSVLEVCGDYYRIDCYDMTGYIPAELVVFRDCEYYVRLDPFAPGTEVLQKYTIADTILLRTRLYAGALEQVGVPYVSGGTTPGGFDCSGFTQYIYARLGITLPRTCDAQLAAGIIIPKEQLQCGDLVLFQRTTGVSALATHVGIYLGGGKLIHAGSRGITVVELESAYFQEHYLCARRIILPQRLPLPVPGAAAAG